MRMHPLAFTPMEPLFRRMIAVSLALHAAVLALLSVWAAVSAPHARFISVAVVDLVGGEAFRPEPEERAVPEASPAPPPPDPSVKEDGKEKLPPPKAAKAEKGSRPEKMPSPQTSRAPDAESLSEIIRKMREKRESADHVREAVGTIRREKDARTAIRQIGERVAHRIDLSAVRPAPRGPSPPAGLAGAAGTARVSPEHLAYFRQLDEKIRSNWTVPSTAPEEREGLMVQLRIVIEKDGEVSNVRMEKTSGNSFFDDSVLRAIRKASPLPVPPAGLRGAEDHYEIGFRFYGAGGAS